VAGVNTPTRLPTSKLTVPATALVPSVSRKVSVLMPPGAIASLKVTVSALLVPRTRLP